MTDRKTRTCNHCDQYEERTAGTGYCKEWDTIMEVSSECLDKIENTAEEPK